MTSDGSRRRLMDELRAQDIRDERVLKAMGKVPRHEFLDDALKSRAYENNALPIGHAQTLSQPYIVALMTEAILSDEPRFAAPHPASPRAAGRGDQERPATAPLHRKVQRVLEVGTGSGYQTAVLAEIVPAVFTVERLRPLSELARRRLAALGYENIVYTYADGMAGWAPHAPYDAIVVTAAADRVPPALLEQLAPGGRCVIPVGGFGAQSLRLIQRQPAGFTERTLADVSFVPLLSGRA